ncbi:hypothetical protein GBF38_006749 [Nibea albiflora]|uniref:Uncharacterized protein n=1 Tax=Nibea albiflora TaxID=240163 RepID=A0ACB7EH45_NIBAL|nr:hypothetical protein GBF38_006749 [Nibea albiflora]
MSIRSGELANRREQPSKETWRNQHGGQLPPKHHPPEAQQLVSTAVLLQPGNKDEATGSKACPARPRPGDAIATSCVSVTVNLFAIIKASPSGST